jgi:3-oxoacyl-[acyl-carrier protein] reductase
MREDPLERIVVVTGAAVGIGRATAMSFGELGDSVYVVDIDAEKGAETAGLIQKARFIHCDVTVPEHVTETMTSISEESGRIDVLVNNAGGFATQREIEDTPVEEWRQVVDLNLTSVFLVTQAALPLLRRSDAGRVIKIGSLAGQLTSYRTAPAYAAAKAGVQRPHSSDCYRVGLRWDHRQCAGTFGGGHRTHRKPAW